MTSKGLDADATLELLFGDMAAVDIFMKFNREVARFYRPPVASEADRRDHIFSACLAAWALVEWVYVEQAEIQCAPLFKATYPTWPVFSAAVTRDCADYAIVRDVQDAFKHRRFTLRTPTTKATVVSATVSTMRLFQIGTEPPPQPSATALGTGTSAVFRADGAELVHKALGPQGFRYFTDVFESVRRYWAGNMQWLS